MSDDRWRRIEDLFHAAADLAPALRGEFLKRACGGDDEMLQQVESLLAQDSPQHNVFEAAVVKAVAQLPEDSNSQTLVLVGKQVGPYVISELIGKGGMGMVFKAHDPKLRRDVAIKFLPSGFAQDPERLSRFQREARMLAALNHPNIATIHGFEESGGTHYLVMELVRGDTLAECVSKGAMPLNEALKVAGQITDALEAAHKQGIIHRDLKPANVKLTTDGKVKMLDFGLAKALEGPQDVTGNPSDTPTQEATRTGVILGTVAYMSPEQARGQAVDARTDLWSLGVVMYEMLTGTRPFDGATTAMVFEGILTKAPVPMRERNPKVPAELQRIIGKLLAKKREERYPTAGAVRDDLRRLEPQMTSGRFRSPNRTSLTKYAIAAVVITALATGSIFMRLRARTHALTDKDTIVLADFNNTTGDAVFDHTLRQGLAVQLEQSPFLSLISDERIHQTLLLMRQPAGAQLTTDITRDLCQRVGGAALIEGSIASLGSQYVLGLEAVNCRTGDTLVREQQTSESKEHVLKALGDAAAKLRAKLGESLVTIQKFDTPLEKATTSSIEALQAYSLAGQMELRASGDPLSMFQRAVRLDPNFAMAYVGLANRYSNLGETILAAENQRKAYDLREHVSALERYYIEAGYSDSNGDFESARRVYEAYVQTYPRAVGGRNNLGVIYNMLGQHEKAISSKLEALRLGLPNYSGVMSSYLFLNRLKEAHEVYKQAQAKGHNEPNMFLYLLAFLENDAATMAKEVAASSGTEFEGDLLYLDADTAAYFGRLDQARKLTRRAVASAERAGLREVAAGYEAEAALREALFGNLLQARQHASAALAFSNGLVAEFAAAMSLALAGDGTKSQLLAADLAKRFPEDTRMRFNYLPTLRAQLALDHTDAVTAIKILDGTTPYELGFTGPSAFSPDLYPVYVRASAFVAAKLGDEGRLEYQKIVDHPGVVLNGPIGALTRLGLGRAYVLQKDMAKARAAYQDFLTLWKNADQDIPILKQAKSEYASLI